MFAGLTLWTFALPAAGASAINGDDKEICAWAAAKAERLYRLPSKLLKSIALAETGRWDTARKEAFAWPWAVGATGGGGYFATKQQAIEEVKRLRKRGVTNIDVGCMQVNLQYHAKAFSSLEQALDPTENAEYAASFLFRLHHQLSSWTRAVAAYHSGDSSSKRGHRYWRRVFAFWNEERRGPSGRSGMPLRGLLRKSTEMRSARIGSIGTVLSIGPPAVWRP